MKNLNDPKVIMQRLIALRDETAEREDHTPSSPVLVQVDNEWHYVSFSDLHRDTTVLANNRWVGASRITGVLLAGDVIMANEIAHRLVAVDGILACHAPSECSLRLTDPITVDLTLLDQYEVGDLVRGRNETRSHRRVTGVDGTEVTVESPGGSRTRWNYRQIEEAVSVGDRVRRDYDVEGTLVDDPNGGWPLMEVNGLTYRITDTRLDRVPRQQAVEVGATVTWTHGSTWFGGTVVSLDGDTATVRTPGFALTEEHPIQSLTVVARPEVGDTVRLVRSHRGISSPLRVTAVNDDDMIVTAEPFVAESAWRYDVVTKGAAPAEEAAPAETAPTDGPDVEALIADLRRQRQEAIAELDIFREQVREAAESAIERNGSEFVFGVNQILETLGLDPVDGRDKELTETVEVIVRLRVSAANTEDLEASLREAISYDYNNDDNQERVIFYIDNEEWNSVDWMVESTEFDTIHSDTDYVD